MPIPAVSLLLLLAGASAGSFGPDAATIAELDFRASQALCSDFHHVVSCRSWRMIVSDVRCAPDPADARRALCTFRQRIPRVGGTETCSAAFQSVGGDWHYPVLPAQGEEWAAFPSLQVAGPACSASGAPDAAAIGAIWARAHDRLSCSVYPEAGRPCPPASAKVGEVRCGFGSDRRVANCEFRLRAPEEYFCRAPFQRLRGGGWAPKGRRGVDGRFSYDQSCEGPIVR
ncbi:MAG TPA: hypothetical protein VFQ67_03310 [Allosphingosinicella sp.]|jgi:hypothetical protein|nr:hypothetical protein [Allosphingosinicella sp.]